jgi:hypothetical protein
MYRYTKELIDNTEHNIKEFKDKESYFEFRKIWALEYIKLSAKIRTHKNMAKQYLWKYREKGNNSSKSKVKIGSNPNYDSLRSYNLVYLQPCATKMLELLDEAKQKSWKLKQEQLETV